MPKRFLHLFIALVAGSLFATAAPTENSPPAILVVGDSLSAGFGLDLPDTWPALLQQKLEEEGYVYKVVNASISGDTSGNGLRRLPRALKIHQPEIVLIELGGNDGLRGIAPSIMKSNLENMILKSKESGAAVILAGMLIPPNYGDDYTAEFAAVYPALAEQHETALIPFFMDGVALDGDLMMSDGIHPNKQAQPLLMENVWTTLQPVLDNEQT